jgi:hypothetical protein
MARAQIALIIPLGDAPGHIPGLRPDQGLPEGGNGYYPDQGLPGGQPYPDQGLPGGGGRPPRPGNRPPGSGAPPHPSHPIHRPGGRPVDPDYGVGEEYPDQGLPGGPVGPTHPWVPPSGEELPPPPEDIADKVVVAVWRPDAQEWTVAVGQGPHPEQND